MTTILDIPLNQIHAHPDNPRKNITVDADFDDLVASIRANGVEQPCFVVDATPTRTDGVEGVRGTPLYLLVGGHRRHAASKVAKAKTLPVILRDDLVTPGQQLRFMLSENLHRLDLSPIETGDAIQALLDLGEGFTPASVAKATGLSARTVKDRLKLASMPESARDRIHSGQVTITDAMAMSEFTTDPDTLTTLTEAAGSDDFAYELQRARDRKTQNAALAKAVRAHTKTGAVVLSGAPDNNDWSAVEDLDDYVESFRIDDVDVDVDAAWAAALDLASQHHATCPGHAVIIQARNYPAGSVFVAAICTDPDTHHPVADTATGSAAADPGRASRDQADLERDAQRKITAEQRANLETAAKVRRAHLGTIVRSDDMPLALKSLRATAKARVGHSYGMVDPTFAAQVLLEHPDAPHLAGDSAALTAAIASAINALTLPAIAILMAMFDGAQADGTMNAPSTWPGHKDYWPTNDRAKSWRKLLVSVYNYAWSPVERELLGDVGESIDESSTDEDQAVAS